MLEPNREIWRYIYIFVETSWLENQKKHILFILKILSQITKPETDLKVLEFERMPNIKSLLHL
jgi:hypothetical protein